MICELDKIDFGKVEGLFTPLDYHLTIIAVIKGVNPGRVFVNNEENPTCAFLIGPEGMYLAGDANAFEFFEQMNTVLKGDINIKALQDGKIDYVLFYPDEAMECGIEKMFEGLDPFKVTRKYMERTIQEECNYTISEQVKSLHEVLQSGEELDGLDDIIENMIKSFSSVEAFLKFGFGYVYVLDQSIVSWCVTDSVVGEHSEIGVETDGDHRQKGYSTETVKAVLMKCKEVGIKTVGWHCWVDNIPSYRLAEKVGFIEHRQAINYFGWYQLNDHHLICGNHYTKLKNYAQATYFYGLSLDIGYGLYWHYFNGACTAYLNQNENLAKRYYKEALARGWKGIDAERSEWFFSVIYQEQDVYTIEKVLNMGI